MIRSITDVDSYTEACKNASEDESMFNVFKVNPDYTWVLEHVKVKQGQDYINIIKRDNPHLLHKEYIDKFKENDLYGGSTTHDYEDHTISPSTLRYLKVLSDLIKIFGNLDGFKIAEIGGGYDGQCKIIKDYFKIDDYHLIDLPEANALSSKYLKKLEVNGVRHSTYDKLKPEKYDLIISNYGYTELSRELQEIYKANIIDGSELGYITCNFIVHVMGGFDTYNRDELLQLKNNTQVLPEEPLTGNNIILIWKKSL